MKNLKHVMAIICLLTFYVKIEAQKIVLPITYRNGANPLISVKVNGQGPYKFMFDTGSPDLVKLDEKLYNELKLTAQDSVLASDGSGLNDRWFPVTSIKTLELGDFKIENAAAMVRNYNRRANVDSIAGVIGLDFFKGMVVELNFEKNEFILSKNALNTNDAFVQPIKWHHGVPQLTLKIGDKNIDALFDTGNTGLLTLLTAQVPKELMMNEPIVVGRAQTINNTFEIKQVQLNQNLNLGSLIFEKPIVILNELLPVANMGIKFLKQMNIIFDINNSLVRLEKFKPKFSENLNGVFNEYAGQYGDRTITINAQGELFIQRPGGTVLKMTNKGTDEFGLEIMPNALLVFERDATKKNYCY